MSRRSRLAILAASLTAAAAAVTVACVAGAQADTAADGDYACTFGYGIEPGEPVRWFRCDSHETVPAVPTTEPTDDTTAPTGPDPTTPPATDPPVTEPPTTEPPTTEPEPATTTTEPAPPTTAAPDPDGPQFYEPFESAAGFYDRFVADVHFREGIYDPNASFHGDHDMACGNPDQTTGRTVHVPDEQHLDITAEVFYHCLPGGNPESGHVMTAMGPAGFGYAVLTFRPDQVFTDVTEVCIDASAYDLGGDNWWEMSIVPASTFAANGGRMDYLTVQAIGIDQSGIAFPADAWVYQIWDNKIRMYQGMDERVFDWYGFASNLRAPRYTHCVRDNGDGTVTAEREVGTGVRTVTANGSFPTGDVVVLFQHSTYDPPKHGSGPDQTTIHWDDVLIR